MIEKSSAADSGGIEWQQWQLLCCKVCTHSSPTRHFSQCDTGPPKKRFYIAWKSRYMDVLGIDNHGIAVGSQTFRTIATKGLKHLIAFPAICEAERHSKQRAM